MTGLIFRRLPGRRGFSPAFFHSMKEFFAGETKPYYYPARKHVLET
jgi:hypothetical protein